MWLDAVDPAPAAVEGLHRPVEAEAVPHVQRGPRPPWPARPGGPCARMSSAKASTFSRSRSRLSRPASRSMPSTSRCSPIHSMTLPDRPRGGRRAASAGRPGAGCRWWPAGARPAPRARRCAGARRARDPVARGPRPGRRATCTGASVALTRVSTAMSAGAAPAASRSWTTATVVATGGVVDPHDQVGVGAGPAGGGVDDLGHPAPVVREQRAGRGHDLGRAAVVDLERVGGGAREVAGRSR